MSDDVPIKRRLVKLVIRGDGQAVLERLLPGAPLLLQPAERVEPETPAVQVLTADGEAVGVLATADAASLEPFLGGDVLAEATLHHLTGGTASHPGQEAQIGLRWQGQEVRAAVPLTDAQRAWRARDEAPAPPEPRRRIRLRKRRPTAEPVAAESGIVARLRRTVAGYYSGQLTWKMTFIGIVISTITMTTILILFGRG